MAAAFPMPLVAPVINTVLCMVAVTYTVTGYCKSLKPLVDEMIKWGEQHRRHLIARHVK